MASFSAQVRNWTDKAKRNFAMVHRSAVDKLYQAVVESTPIKTGNARRSWAMSTTAMPQIAASGLASFMPADIGLSIATLPPGSPVYIGAQAIYMPRLNYGFTGTDSLGRSYDQAGLLFIERNAERWDEFVQAAAREIGGAVSLAMSLV
jgi:hypothetical protein